MSYPVINRGETGQAELISTNDNFCDNVMCAKAASAGGEYWIITSTLGFVAASDALNGWNASVSGQVTVSTGYGFFGEHTLQAWDNTTSSTSNKCPCRLQTYKFIVPPKGASSSSSTQSSSSQNSSLQSHSSQISSLQSGSSQSTSSQNSSTQSSNSSGLSSNSSTSHSSSSSSLTSSCSSMSSSNTSLSSGCCTEMAFGIQRIVPWCDYHTCDFGEPGLTTFINDMPIPNALWLLELQEGGDAKVTAGLIPNDLMDESFVTDVDLYFRPEDPEDPTKSNGEVYHYCVKVKYGAAPHNPCPPAMQSVDEAQDFFLEY
jgi:hypothetical protein